MDIESIVGEMEEEASTGDEWKSALETKIDKLQAIKDDMDNSVLDIRQLITQLNDISEASNNLTRQIAEAETEDISL